MLNILHTFSAVVIIFLLMKKGSYAQTVMELHLNPDE